MRTNIRNMNENERAEYQDKILCQMTYCENEATHLDGGAFLCDEHRLYGEKVDVYGSRLCD